jgi:hypothetical protein
VMKLFGKQNDLQLTRVQHENHIATFFVLNNCFQQKTTKNFRYLIIHKQSQFKRVYLNHFLWVFKLLFCSNILDFKIISTIVNGFEHFSAIPTWRYLKIEKIKLNVFFVKMLVYFIK